MKPGSSNDANLEKTKETILANISEIENGLRIVAKMPDMVSGKPSKKKEMLLENVRQRIRSLMELITEGNNTSNLPPDPDWIKNENNKKMLQEWYKDGLIKDAEILKKVKVMLEPASSKAGFTPSYSPKAAPKAAPSKPTPSAAKSPAGEKPTERSKQDNRGNAPDVPLVEEELIRYLQVRSDAKPGEWVKIKNSEWEVGRGTKSGNLAIANKDYHIELNSAGQLTCHIKAKDYEVTKVNFLRLLDSQAKNSIKNNEIKLFIATAVGMQPGQWNAVPAVGNWEIGVSKFSKNPSIANNSYQIELEGNKLKCLDKKNGYKEIPDFNFYAQINLDLRVYLAKENAKASNKPKKSPGM